MAWKKDQIKPRPYQIEDCNSLIDMERMLVACDTGVGKTVTYLYTAEKLMARRKIIKTFIYCPASTLDQIESVIRKNTTSDCVVVRGNPKQRQQCYYKARRDSVKYVLMGMSVTLWNERKKIESLVIACKKKGELAVVVDEAYYLKSGPHKVNEWDKEKPKRVRAIFALREYFKYRFPVTGTPVQNIPGDIYWLFYFMYDRKILGSKNEFDQTYSRFNQWGVPVGFRNLNKFYRRIEPYMIRREATDPEVSKYMPKMVVENILVDIPSNSVRKLYYKIRQDTISALTKLASYGPDQNLDAKRLEQKRMVLRKAQSRYAHLRMLCVGGSYLIKKRADNLVAENKKRSEKKTSYALQLVTNKETAKYFVKPIRGPKLDTIPEFVSSILRENPKFKFVIFSFFKDIVEDVRVTLGKHVKCKIVTCKGGDNAQEKKDQFNEDPNTRILITTDANKEGVDLPGGSHLIHLDVPANHALWHQRSTRIRRNGSKHKRVFIFNAIARGTIEERQWDHIERTHEMSNAIVDGMKHRREVIEESKGRVITGLKLNEKSLLQFLKSDTFGIHDDEI